MLLDRLRSLIPQTPLFNNVISGARKVMGGISDQVGPIVRGTGEFGADVIERAVNLPNDMVQTAGRGGEALGNFGAGLGLMMEEPRRQQTVMMNSQLRQKIRDQAAGGKLSPERAQQLEAGLPKDTPPPLVQEIEKNPFMFGASKAYNTALGVGSILSLVSAATAGIKGLMAMDGGQTAAITSTKQLEALYPHAGKHVLKSPTNEVLNSKMAASVIEDAKRQIAGKSGMNNPELAARLDAVDPTTIRSWGDLVMKMTDTVKHDPTAVKTILNHAQTRWSMYVIDPASITQVAGPEFVKAGMPPVNPSAPAASTPAGLTPKEYSSAFKALESELTKTPQGKTAVIMGTLNKTGPDQFTRYMVSDMIKTLGGLDKAVKNPIFKNMIENLFKNIIPGASAQTTTPQSQYGKT